jgi:thermostable 8-oxoguanine DNA glycosylase
LFDLDYKKILDEYTVEELFCKFKENEDLRVNDTKNKNNNTWHKWANSIIDSAKFISRFNSINEFASLVKSFDYCILSRAALAYLLAGNIKNIGFTLACDALKELGFSNYCKPDTHIIKICSELKLCKNTELDVFETVTKIAEDNNVSPYRVDKIFWLISSGNYYKNKNIKKKRLSEEFISLVKKELQI